MYSHCLFCYADLGSNEQLGYFPVGRRLAFDADRGRLWVVCPACERWNLSPLEERWEAVESCERLFSGTRLRISTEHIGLARVAEGLELVRIGRPLRPEMAAWRYGDQFGRRHHALLVRSSLVVGLAGATLLAGPAALGLGAGAWLLSRALRRLHLERADPVIAHVPVSENHRIRVRRSDLPDVRLYASWTLKSWRLQLIGDSERHRLTGEAAIRAAGMLLPAINRFGGTQRQVRSAVELLEREEDPWRVFYAGAKSQGHGRNRVVSELPRVVRLAMEMAAHEDTERRAFEGELRELERAWREAEEIAAIADTLLIPSPVEEALLRMRRVAGMLPPTR